MRALAEYAALIEAIARFAPVSVVADPAQAAEAREQCGFAGVEVLELPIDDVWIRDNGPIYLVDGNDGVALLQFRFNAWGEKYLPYDKDADLPRRLAEVQGMRRFTLGAGDGGRGLHGRRRGHADHDRVGRDEPEPQPGLVARRVEAALCEGTGAEKVIWLAHGLAEDRDTDGTPTTSCSSPGRAASWSRSRRTAPTRTTGRCARRRAPAARDRRAGPPAGGRRGAPAAIHRARRDRLAVPYVNFYPVNGAVIAPRLDAPGEDEAFALLAELHPGREVVGVESTMLAYGGGGIGCVTQHVPAGDPIPAPR